MNKYLFFFSIIVFLAKTGNVFSDTNIFDVDNIEVGNEISINKSKQIDRGFRLGFEKLVKKILLNSDIKKVLDTDITQIKKLILKYQILENIDTTKESSLKMNISFNREKLNNFFYDKNILYADITKTKIVLFPVLFENNEYFIFDKNYFYNSWNEDEKETDLIEYILPAENIDDILLIRKYQNSLESIDVKKILSKYDIKDYIFLIINSENDTYKIFLKGLTSGNEVIKSFALSTTNKNIEVRKKELIKKIKTEVSETWKSQNLIDVRTPSFLNIFLDIKKNDDLLNLQRVLNKIELIQKHSVIELNKDYARIKIRYIGEISKIKSKFTEQKIKINIVDNQWTLRLS